ncbi:hypothetical protein KUTeg_000098 [Tegillarca granosa]|uniref:Uncharacterized protein n=1 Tax=Tegillarca granosa TaxID=220873 RepID=A0ABQ9G018_TEGGR|nr:hypothetical protein KUTeg_000098 [Tegillarca granosa]
MKLTRNQHPRKQRGSMDLMCWIQSQTFYQQFWIRKKQNFLQKHVNLTPDKLKIIEKGTRQQNQSSKKKINIIKLWSHYQKRPVKTILKEILTLERVCRKKQ